MAETLGGLVTTKWPPVEHLTNDSFNLNHQNVMISTLVTTNLYDGWIIYLSVCLSPNEFKYKVSQKERIDVIILSVPQHTNCYYTLSTKTYQTPSFEQTCNYRIVKTRFVGYNSIKFKLMLKRKQNRKNRMTKIVLTSLRCF